MLSKRDNPPTAKIVYRFNIYMTDNGFNYRLPVIYNKTK